MFEERNLLYFDEYFFENGNPAKSKYFLVLKCNQAGIMLISLPSSKDYIPADIDKKHGCINIPEKQIGCYFFQNKVQITECGFGFPLDTYLYAALITSQTIEVIEHIYKPKDYKLIGKLLQKEHNNIVNCLKNSPNIKSKFKRIL
nr:hypothetical protein [uncultured Flavobacterium sp.]